MLFDRKTFARLMGDPRGAICQTWLNGAGFDDWASSVAARADNIATVAGFFDVPAASVQAAIRPATERAVARRLGAVAVVPIRGPIFAKPNFFELFGMGTSAETIGRLVTEAVNDPDVKAVVLDVDSPGGSVSGVSELAKAIMDMRGKKPIVAHANFMAASAAYHIAAAADEIIASPSALVGSIGVFILHMDFSEALKMDGVKPTFIASAPEKVDGNPLEPLSETGEAELRALVDSAMEIFVADVARGRGVSPESVRGDYGKGHILTARAALKAGMIDKIRPFDETLAAYGVGRTPAPTQAASGARRARVLNLKERISANRRG